VVDYIYSNDGAGTISPLGNNIHDVFNRCLEGKSGLKSVDDYYVKDNDGKDWRDDYQKHGIHSLSFIDEENRLECQSICGGKERMKSEAMMFAEFASIKALEDAKWDPNSIRDRLRTGVCLGNSMVDLDYISVCHDLVNSGKGRKVSPFFVPRILCNMAAGYVAIRFGFRGPNHSVSTACATGSHAIGDAYNFIKNNDADVMLAGGSDTCINPLSLIGFTRARALSTKYEDSPQKASRPFDQDRDGFVMAEGAAILVLEELNHAVERGANIYCELSGYGASCDANHITSGLEDGSGALLSIVGAMAAVEGAAVVDKFQDELWQVNAHATSTPKGDIAELNAIRSSIDLLAKIKNNSNLNSISIPFSGPYITANKSNLGHMIGAAGTIESAIAALSLKHGKIPGILNLDNPEQDEDVRLLKHSIQEPRNSSCDKRRLVLKNSFGFGGTNVSLIFAEYLGK